MSSPHWPIWDLVVRTPRLELRPIREADTAELVELAERGIHDPATMPFLTPFTDLEPTDWTSSESVQVGGVTPDLLDQFGLE